MRKSGAIVWLCAGLCCPREAAAQDRRPSPTYTNEDLERVAPYRGETGVLSKPAKRDDPRAAPEPEGRGEAYWRREAERLRTRLRPLRQRAVELAERLKDARTDTGRKRSRGTGGSRGGSAEALARKLESVEAEIREREDELHERARRARALPGWLR